MNHFLAGNCLQFIPENFSLRVFYHLDMSNFTLQFQISSEFEWSYISISLL